MKLLISLGLLFSLTIPVSGQNQMSGYEYWFNSDDSLRIFVPVTNTQNLLLNNESFDISALQPGYHFVNVRLKDSSGSWSAVIRKPLSLISPSPHYIAGYEYWVNSDDSARIFVEVGTGNSILLTDETLMMTLLPPGFNQISMRLLDTHGHWSSVVRKPVTVQAEPPFGVAGYEYWFNLDDSIRLFNEVSGDLNFHSAIEVLDVSGLLPGFHLVNLRLKDLNGNWSSVIRKPIQIAKTSPTLITAIRYWSTQSATNPANMTVLDIDPPVEQLEILQHLDFCHFPTSGLQTVFFQMLDDQGDWSLVMSKDVQIDVINQAPLQATMINGPVNVCVGDTISYAVPEVVGASWYTWTLPEGWQGSSDEKQIKIIVGTLSGQISVTAHNFCGTGPAQHLALNVFTAPPTLPDQIFGLSSVCSDFEYLYQINEVPNATSYAWEIPAGWTGASDSLSIHVISGSSGGFISVSAMNACGNSDYQELAVTSVLTQTPSITINSTTSEICEGEEVTFTASAVHGGNNPQFNWLVNGTSTGVNTQVFVADNLSHNDTIRCEVTSSLECVTIAMATSEPIVVTVNPVPPQPVIEESTHQLTSSAATGNQWYLNGELINGATEQVFVPLLSGLYHVIVTNDFGCVSLPSEPVHFTYTSVESIVWNDLELFPNPGSGTFTIRHTVQGPVWLKVMDVRGVTKVETEIHDPVELLHLDLPAGVYFLKFKAPEGIAIRKLIIQ